jgi:predicted acylesterase/phospholipase RssA
MAEGLDWEESLRREDSQGKVTLFAVKHELKKDVRILAANLRTRLPEVFDSVVYSNLELAEAVRASMSIPFIFRPFEYTPLGQKKSVFVDGGMISNLPAWLFASEAENSGIPILGLTVRSASVERNLDSFGGFAWSLVETVLSGPNKVQERMLSGKLKTVDIHTEDYDTLETNVNKREKKALYYSGYHAADLFMRSIKMGRS